MAVPHLTIIMRAVTEMLMPTLAGRRFTCLGIDASGVSDADQRTRSGRGEQWYGLIRELLL